MADNVQASQLTDLAGQSLPDALARLRADGLLSNAAVDEALHLALTLAAAEPLAVTGWMHLLAAWAGATGDDPATTALLQYVRSRLALENGDFDAAETSLLSARATWQQIGDAISLARSGLGLTQLLAMQGRFDEAESVIRASIAGLDAAGDAEAAAAGDGQTVLLAMDARQNLATLLSYQERHAEALALTSDLRLTLLDLLAQADIPVEAADLQVRLGLVERDCALACIYLDQPQEAEELLLAAVERLGLPEARGERGQTRTNLGHLYTRMGRYAQALVQFDAATLDLLGTSDAQSAPDRWPLADLLFLEQAALSLFGPDARPVPAPFTLKLQLPWFGYSGYKLFVVVATIAILLAVWWFMTRTRAGLVMRATQVDRQTARAFGINVDRVYAGVFALGAGLAAVAAVLLVPISQAHYLMGGDPLLLSFIVVIIGGLGSLRGTLVAALIIGLSDGVISMFYSPTLAKIIATAAVAMVLVFRPQGLFGAKA